MSLYLGRPRGPGFSERVAAFSCTPCSFASPASFDLSCQNMRRAHRLGIAQVRERKQVMMTWQGPGFSERVKIVEVCC